MSGATDGDPRRRPIVLGSGDGRSYDCGTMRADFLADGEETGDTYSISEWTLDPGCSGVGAHAHEANDDVFYVLDGTVTFTLDDDTVAAPAGTFVRVPTGVLHDFANHGDTTARMLNIYVPGGFEQDMPGIVDWFSRPHPTGEH